MCVCTSGDPDTVLCVCAGQEILTLCRQDGAAEDLAMSACMAKLGVRADNATDALGRDRFYCFRSTDHLIGQYPRWYYNYRASNGVNRVRTAGLYYNQRRSEGKDSWRLPVQFSGVQGVRTAGVYRTDSGVQREKTAGLYRTV